MSIKYLSVCLCFIASKDVIKDINIQLIGSDGNPMCSSCMIGNTGYLGDVLLKATSLKVLNLEWTNSFGSLGYCLGVKTRILFC